MKFRKQLLVYNGNGNFLALKKWGIIYIPTVYHWPYDDLLSDLIVTLTTRKN